MKAMRKHSTCCSPVRFLDTCWLMCISFSSWHCFLEKHLFTVVSVRLHRAFKMCIITSDTLRLNSAGSCRSPHLGLVLKTSVFNYKSQISPFSFMNLWNCEEQCRQFAQVQSFLSQGLPQNHLIVLCWNVAACKVSQDGMVRQKDQYLLNCSRKAFFCLYRIF